MSMKFIPAINPKDKALQTAIRVFAIIRFGGKLEPHEAKIFIDMCSLALPMKYRFSMLNAALNVDDILYENFRRMNDELKKEWAHLYRAKQVVRVVQQTKHKGVVIALQIERIDVTPDGTLVTVR